MFIKSGLCLQAPATHLNIVPSCQSQHGDRPLIAPFAEAMVVAEFVRSASVSHHMVLVAPFPSQDFGEEVVICSGWDSIIRMVGAHYTPRISIDNGPLERWQVAVTPVVRQ